MQIHAKIRPLQMDKIENLSSQQLAMQFPHFKLHISVYVCDGWLWCRCRQTQTYIIFVDEGGSPLHHYSYLISVNYAVSVIVVMKTMLISPFIRCGPFPLRYGHGGDVSTLPVPMQTPTNFDVDHVWDLMAATAHPMQWRGPWNMSMIRQLIDDRQMVINWYWRTTYIVPTDRLLYLIHLEPNTAEFTVWQRLPPNVYCFGFAELCVMQLWMLRAEADTLFLRRELDSFNLQKSAELQCDPGEIYNLPIDIGIYAIEPPKTRKNIHWWTLALLLFFTSLILLLSVSLYSIFFALRLQQHLRFSTWIRRLLTFIVIAEMIDEKKAPHQIRDPSGRKSCTSSN